MSWEPSSCEERCEATRLSKDGNELRRPWPWFETVRRETGKE